MAKTKTQFQPSHHVELKRDLKTLEKLTPKPEDCLPPISLSEFQIFEIERMASQGMTLNQISARLGIDIETFRALISADPAIARTYRAGLARGIDEQSQALQSAGKAGDVGAAKFFLQTRGEFHVPKDTAGSAPIQITIDDSLLDRIDSSADRQRKILDGQAVEIEPS